MQSKSTEETSEEPSPPTGRQPDLFGVVDKREREIEALIARNKADKASGIRPVAKPLFEDQ